MPRPGIYFNTIPGPVLGADESHAPSEQAPGLMQANSSDYFLSILLSGR